MVTDSKLFKTLVLDTEKGICTLNGADISNSTSELHLDFENGMWSLAVTQTIMYTANDKNLTELA